MQTDENPNRSSRRPRISWLEIGAQLVRAGCDETNATDIARWATAQEQPLYALRKKYDDWLDRVAFDQKVVDAIAKVVRDAQFDGDAKPPEK